MAKLVVMVAHRRDGNLPWDLKLSVAGWERVHMITSMGLAVMLGLAVLTIFASDDIALHMLITGMVFGYGAGVVSRLSGRPKLAIPLLLVTALPAAGAAAFNGSAAHGMLAFAFLVFLVSSLESVRHMHLGVIREIGMRLDMATLARTDPLTGLANRLGLRQAFRELPEGGKKAPFVVVHCFDLDRFKPVNDRYGHAVGDELLRILAARLNSLLRDTDAAARIGGDEFVVLQSPVHHPDEAEMFAGRLWRAITGPYAIDGFEIRIGASLGYAITPPDPRELDGLLATADAALYRMKNGDHGGGDRRWVAA
jgi:diguanylate cyclase (GGDEF)-like protein